MFNRIPKFREWNVIVLSIFILVCIIAWVGIIVGLTHLIAMVLPSWAFVIFFSLPFILLGWLFCLEIADDIVKGRIK